MLPVSHVAFCCIPLAAEPCSPASEASIGSFKRLNPVALLLSLPRSKEAENLVRFRRVPQPRITPERYIDACPGIPSTGWLNKFRAAGFYRMGRWRRRCAYRAAHAARDAPWPLLLLARAFPGIAWWANAAKSLSASPTLPFRKS